jgi:hypothetical protein
LAPFESGALAPLVHDVRIPRNGTRFRDKHGVEWILVRNDIDVEADLRVVHVPAGNAHRTDGDLVTLSVSEVDTLRMKALYQCSGCEKWFLAPFSGTCDLCAKKAREAARVLKA